MNLKQKTLPWKQLVLNVDFLAMLKSYQILLDLVWVKNRYTGNFQLASKEDLKITIVSDAFSEEVLEDDSIINLEALIGLVVDFQMDRFVNSMNQLLEAHNIEGRISG